MTEASRARRLALGMAIALGLMPLGGHGAAPQDRTKIEAGEAVYNDYCFTCQGEKLVSSGQTYDLRRLTANDRARFENSVRMGKNQMPPWKDLLTREQIDQIWHFIRDNAHEK